MSISSGGYKTRPFKGGGFKKGKKPGEFEVK